MTGIHHFIEDVEKNKGISASKLDNNFRRVGPITGLDGNAHGYRIEETEDGWRLVLEEAEGAGVVDHPWRIKRTLEGLYYVQQGDVFRTVWNTGRMSITGLGKGNAVAYSEHFVILELDITQGSTSTPPVIATGRILWGQYPHPSPITSTKANLQLGYISETGSITQIASQDYKLVNMCVNGASSLVPFST